VKLRTLDLVTAVEFRTPHAEMVQNGFTFLFAIINPDEWIRSDQEIETPSRHVTIVCHHEGANVYANPSEPVEQRRAS
jgi:hypothetical protein